MGHAEVLTAAALLVDFLETAMPRWFRDGAVVDCAVAKLNGVECEA